MLEVETGNPEPVRDNRKRAFWCALVCLLGVFLVVYSQAFGAMIGAMRDTDGLYIPATQQQGEPETAGGQKQVVSTFQLYNLSNRPLQIKAEADCSCSALSWSERTLGPWQRLELTAHMRIKPSSSRASSNISLLVSSDAGLKQPVRKLVLQEPAS